MYLRACMSGAVGRHRHDGRLLGRAGGDLAADPRRQGPKTQPRWTRSSNLLSGSVGWARDRAHVTPSPECHTVEGPNPDPIIGLISGVEVLYGIPAASGRDPDRAERAPTSTSGTNPAGPWLGATPCLPVVRHPRCRSTATRPVGVFLKGRDAARRVTADRQGLRAVRRKGHGLERGTLADRQPDRGPGRAVRGKLDRWTRVDEVSGSGLEAHVSVLKTGSGGDHPSHSTSGRSTRSDPTEPWRPGTKPEMGMAPAASSARESAWR